MCSGFIFKLQNANLFFVGNEHFSGSFQRFYPELPESQSIEDLLTPTADYHNDCDYYYYCYYYYCYHYYTLNILTGLNLLCYYAQVLRKRTKKEDIFIAIFYDYLVESSFLSFLYFLSLT